METKDIENLMFKCEKLRAKITPRSCIKNQRYNKKYELNNPCIGCKKGKEILPEKIQKQELEYKTCRTWKFNPDLCTGYNDGIFYRDCSHTDPIWNRKKHCNDYCYRAWYRKQYKANKINKRKEKS